MGLTLLSQNVLADSIAALGITIAFYYGINGYAVPLFYRHHVFESWKTVLMLLVFPLVGAAILTWVLIASFDSLWYPANSASGTSWFGVGPPFVLGAVFLVLGVVGMLAFWAVLQALEAVLRTQDGDGRRHGALVREPGGAARRAAGCASRRDRPRPGKAA